MATRAKTPAKSGTPKRAGKPAPRRTGGKKPERWNDPPRGRNPLGLVVVAAAAVGLVYTACAPKTGPGGSAPGLRVQAPVSDPAPVVRRGRYEPRPSVRVAEEPAREETPRRRRIRAVEQPAPEPKKPIIDEDAQTDVAVAPVPETAPDADAPDATDPMDAAQDTPPAGDQDATPKPAVPTPVAPVVPRPAPITPPIAPSPVVPPAPRPVRRVAVRGEFAHNPAATGEVALTFDGCYDDKPLPRILNALQHHGYRATFFIAGKFADRYPSSVKRISDAGMEVGNHSWSHPAFTKLSDRDIDRQLDRTNDLIKKITGKTPNLFRPPFGARDDRVRRAVSDEGFKTVYWALDSLDSVKKGITGPEIAQRVLSRVQPGDVVLLHVGSQATADALPLILKGLDERGLRVVPVSELMTR